MNAVLDYDFRLIRWLIADTGNVAGQLERHGWPKTNNDLHKRYVLLGSHYASAPPWGARRVSWAQISLLVTTHYLPPVGQRWQRRHAMVLDEANFHRIHDAEVKAVIEFGYMIGLKYRQTFRKNAHHVLNATWGFVHGCNTRKMLDDLEATFNMLTQSHENMEALQRELRAYGWRKS